MTKLKEGIWEKDTVQWMTCPQRYIVKVYDQVHVNMWYVNT